MVFNNGEVNLKERKQDIPRFSMDSHYRPTGCTSVTLNVYGWLKTATTTTTTKKKKKKKKGKTTTKRKNNNKQQKHQIITFIFTHNSKNTSSANMPLLTLATKVLVFEPSRAGFPIPVRSGSDCRSVKASSPPLLVTTYI